MDTSTKIWHPDHLVLTAGGSKIFMLIGALMTLEKNGSLDQIKTVVTCSTSSLVGLFYCLGFRLNDIIQHMIHPDFLGNLETISLRNLGKNFGLWNNTAMEQTLEKILMSKFDYIPTLKDVSQISGIDLVITVSNVTRGRTEFLSKETEPDLTVINAISMATSIPLINSRTEYKGCNYIDGILTNPYPINYFDNKEETVLGIFTDNSNDQESTHLVNYINQIICPGGRFNQASSFPRYRQR